MTEQEKETKKRREEAIEALKEMRDMMMESDNWESLMRLVDAVTMGAFAIARLNEIDYGKEESDEQEEVDDWRDRLDELEREEYYESKYTKGESL